jgi:titin
VPEVRAGDGTVDARVRRVQGGGRGEGKLVKRRRAMRIVLGVLVAVAVLWASVAGAASNVLSWTDNSGNEVNFNVERKAEACAGTGAFTFLVSTTANVATVIDGTVVEGLEYCYRVNASNTAGVSAWSNTAGRLVPFTIPAAPSLLGVTSGK